MLQSRKKQTLAKKDSMPELKQVQLYDFRRRKKAGTGIQTFRAQLFTCQENLRASSQTQEAQRNTLQKG